MKKIYHLGLHKTGSTTLQSFLHRNRNRLLQAGILFPPVTPEGWARLDGTEDESARLPTLNDYMGHNALAYRMIAEAVPGFVFPKVHEPMQPAVEVLKRVQQQAQRLCTPILVFCSEDLARASLMNPDIPLHFARTFGAEDVTLMAAVRRPDEAIIAWQTQRLRFGLPFSALRNDPPETWLGSVHFEYRAALEPWLVAFPSARLEIVPYSRQQTNGGAVGAFTRYLDAACPADLAPVDNANLGLPYILVELARQGLAHLNRPTANALIRYCETVTARVDLPENSEVEPFSSDTRRILALAFNDIHHWLAQITGVVPFFDDVHDIARPRPLPVENALRSALPALIADASEHLPNAEAFAFLKGL